MHVPLNVTVLSARVAGEGGACRHLHNLAFEYRSLHITVLATINCIKSDECHSHYKPKESPFDQTITNLSGKYEWAINWWRFGQKVTLLVYSVRQALWQTPLDVTTWPKPELPVYKVQLLQLKCNCYSEWQMHNFVVYTCPFWSTLQWAMAHDMHLQKTRP